MSQSNPGRCPRTGDQALDADLSPLYAYFDKLYDYLFGQTYNVPPRALRVSGLRHGVEVDNPNSDVHGVGGLLMDTTGIQTIRNKTISKSDNTLSNLRLQDMSDADVGNSPKYAVLIKESGIWKSDKIGMCFWELGSWDMSAEPSRTYQGVFQSQGGPIPSHKALIVLDGAIYRDDGQGFPLAGYHDASVLLGFYRADSAVGGGVFIDVTATAGATRSANYSSTANNRGYILAIWEL